MSKKEKESPVIIVWWRLITMLVSFIIAAVIALVGYNIYLKSIPG